MKARPAWPSLAAVLSLLLLSAGPAVAASSLDAARPVIPLSNGLNTLTLTAAPLPARAFLAHRENFNAHGFDVLTLYIEAPPREGAKPQWQIVPVFNAKTDGPTRREQLALTTADGADCRLRDFRLVAATAGADALLVLADRALGESFASPAQVTFRFFKLKRGSMPGQALYYFEFDHDRRAGKPYCDVGEALQTELGIGPYQPAER